MEDFHNVWGKAYGLDKRGRHGSFASAVEASLKTLTAERCPFFDTVCNHWKRLFPDQPAHPGAWHDNCVVLYVAKSTTLYLMRPRLPAIKRQLATLPGAPKAFAVRLEIHAPPKAEADPYRAALLKARRAKA